jgi:hypothetical protein
MDAHLKYVRRMLHHKFVLSLFYINRNGTIWCCLLKKKFVRSKKELYYFPYMGIPEISKVKGKTKQELPTMPDVPPEISTIN